MNSPSAGRAEALAQDGHVAEALALLVAAGARGDAEALMLHAVWLLRGTPLPRDLPAARALLQRAVAVGHVDAALMDIALTANGSGGPSDWHKAYGLLATAAHGDPVAAAQLALLDQMALTGDGWPQSPSTPETLSQSPRILRFRGFLTPAECAHIASVAAEMLEPARVIDPVSGQWVPHPIRTSDDAAIGPTREDLVIRAINLRIAAASGTRVEQGEALTVLRYRPGQQYRPHLDTIAGAGNQRIKTMLIYLNQGYSGGETAFPDADVTIAARGGDAVLFDNTLSDGRPDPASRHAGLPVMQGVKWLATRWIRAKPFDVWNMPAS